jgi:hypothetical protein
MSRESRTRRRVGLARAALVAVIGMVGLLAAPGTASAHYGVVTPLFECVTKLHGADGWTALLGYSNTGNAPVTWAVGPGNVLRPSARNGEQPTTFQPGTHRGVFTVAFKTGNSVSWTVGGISVNATMNSKRCPASTELPAEGNGTGPAIVLVSAGVIGAVVLHRARRRALHTTVRTGGDRDDA